jgi:hypothetical protein
MKVSALGVEEQRVNVLVDFTEPRAKWEALGDGYRVEASCPRTASTATPWHEACARCRDGYSFCARTTYTRWALTSPGTKLRPRSPGRPRATAYPAKLWTAWMCWRSRRQPIRRWKRSGGESFEHAVTFPNNDAGIDAGSPESCH